jgi:hypothetical protein
LILSNANLYAKRKEEILSDSKLYIDHLKNSGQLNPIPPSSIEDAFGGYGGLGFQGDEFEEFIELSAYINDIRELAKKESMPAAAQVLLDVMQIDSRKFYRMICLIERQYEDVLPQTYYDVPILLHVELNTFMEKLLHVNHETQRRIFWALNERYKFDEINTKLVQELTWLKSVKESIRLEIDNRKGKVSGFNLESLVEHYLNKSIKKLEIKQAEIQVSQE